MLGFSQFTAAVMLRALALPFALAVWVAVVVLAVAEARDAKTVQAEAQGTATCWAVD